MMKRLALPILLLYLMFTIHGWAHGPTESRHSHAHDGQLLHPATGGKAHSGHAHADGHEHHHQPVAGDDEQTHAASNGQSLEHHHNSIVQPGKKLEFHIELIVEPLSRLRVTVAAEPISHVFAPICFRQNTPPYLLNRTLRI